MKAIIAPRYGGPDVLQARDRSIPRPGADEVLVRVYAAGVNPADLHRLRGQPAFLRLAGNGLRRPRNDVPGSDVAGQVEAIGKDVTELELGDEVFADLSGAGQGAFAEFVAAPASVWVAKPASVSFEAAAAVPMAGTTALQGLRDHGRLSAGWRVLVNGASGGVGSFAVQIAKAMGARVTGVSSARNADLVTSLGADRAIDYAREDFTAGREPYDLVFDTVGNRPLREIRRVVAPQGAFVSTAFLPDLLVARLWPGQQRLRAMFARPNPADLTTLAQMLEAGSVVPVIDRTYPVERAVDALTHVAGRHARGKVILTA